MIDASEKPFVLIEGDVIPAFIKYCSDQNYKKFLMIADNRTYQALGKRVEDALLAVGFNLRKALLSGSEEIIADEEHIIQVMNQMDAEERVFLAVGSGTITDITRFLAHRTRSTFISLPTAPSVDGFVSVGAPLVFRGLKETADCKAPAAAFADLSTLAAAPKLMIAAGFGDLLGKYTSLADWKLGHILWDERYDAHVEASFRAALNKCVSSYAHLAEGDPKSMYALIDGLIGSGMGIIEYGNTQPASGAEHHISHHWEMKLLWQHRPGLLHGAKVGVGTIITAAYYEKIKKLTLNDVNNLLNETIINPEEEKQAIRNVYPSISDRLIDLQSPFINMDQNRLEALKERILTNWDTVLEIAASVPPSAELRDMLAAVGGPTTPAMLGFSDAEAREAILYSNNLRRRFTSLKLCHFLNIL
ncbi:MAG: sn-glycerol-1-phosphate dehydrogenase [Anaerolineae bacterium]|nr:sn-glycerol-1-phosphate dehydrogenase [Anaerolineae bacterium]